MARLRAGMRYEFERTAAPEHFPTLPLVPAGRYTDPEFLALEMAHMWKKAWVYACHLDEIPEPGHFLLFSRLGSPILIVHGKDGEVRAFYNTCAHRGAPLVKDACGKVEGLVCQYHGWTYGLDGRLLNLRDKRDFKGLDLSCHALAAVRCERLGNFIFVTEDRDAQPLLEHLGHIPWYFAELKPEQTRFVHKKSYHVKCNVKVLLDAFLEVYHLKSIHQNTVDRFLDHRGTTITLWPRGHSFMFTPNRRPDWEDPGTRGMPKVAGVSATIAKNNPSFMGYPNLVTPVADSGIPFILFWPCGPREMEIEVVWFSPDTGGEPLSPLWETRIANFERILYEDTQFAEYIQQSVESPGFRGLTLNYQERRIYHWHEELDRRIGPERIPEHLRVAQVLAPFVTADAAARPPEG
jgi:phenylpropionate dioxygenase-like ring-hydroxylating dioxygenase large terminal subunit